MARLELGEGGADPILRRFELRQQFSGETRAEAPCHRQRIEGSIQFPDDGDAATKSLIMSRRYCANGDGAGPV
jgi:hypothetical protein